ncbi:MAG: UbiD family decarboxylase [Deltaproteobacteria bacterium]|nr:MAG: UbiD family decarboxylase [Deltaproteobacteria bacterium]
MLVRDIPTLIQMLRKEQDIVEISAPVDPTLELAEIHRRVIAANGPALLFTNVKGHDIPVVTNLYGTKRRVDLAMGSRPKAFVEDAVRLIDEIMPPTLGKLWAERDFFMQAFKLGNRSVGSGPVTQVVETPPDLERIPMIKSWPEDGGHFVTLPLVYTEPPSGHGAPNLGMYRIQRHSKTTTGMHWQIGKGGGFHHHQAIQRGEDLPVTLFVGGPPALTLSAIAPLPENVPELLLASLLLGERLPLAKNPVGHPHPLVATAEFAFVGHVKPNEKQAEGPFGDHYGYYSLMHDYPVFHVQAVCQRKDAVWPATVVGKPRQEDLYIGDYLQELLSPIFPIVMPNVKDLWSYGETGYHALAGAVVEERYEREAVSAAFRVLGEGQLALTKFLWVVDEPLDLKDPKAVLTHLLARFRPETDLYVLSNLSMDTLDYAGPEVNKGSKGIMLGTGKPWRELPTEWRGDAPGGIDQIEVFCPGCLVVSGPSWEEDREYAERVVGQFGDWPLVVLVDDAKQAASTNARFLWTTFTRFEPAANIHAAGSKVVRHHVAYEGTVLIDSRFKNEYPGELFCDPDTAKTVTDRWNEYFPSGGVEMGDSDAAHLDEPS